MKLLVLYYLILSKDYGAHFDDHLLQYADPGFVNWRSTN